MAGRPAHAPSDKLRGIVEGMASVGATHDEIAASVGVTKKTLYLRYRPELDRGIQKGNVRLRRALFNKAVGDGPQSVAAAIFLHKVRLGMRETAGIELTGKDGGPIEMKEETARDRIKRRLERLSAGLPLLPSATERDVEETEAEAER